MNIFFTCAGRRTYLLNYFREQLNRHDLIIAGDLQLTAPALSVADIKIQLPSIYAPEYVDELINICIKYDVTAIIPLNDLELPLLSKNKKRFSAVGTTVIVSDYSFIDICFDKIKTASFIKSLHLNTPKTYSNYESAVNAINNGVLSFPLVLKPRWGSGSIGIESAADFEELDLVYKLLRKKIMNSILENASSSSDDYVIIQQKICGNEYGLDIINDLKGNHLFVSIKQKLSMRAGETDKAVTIDSSELKAIGQLIGKSTSHIANLDCDILEDNGIYYVLEMNPRFGGGFPFSYESGVNLPGAIVKWLRGQFDISGLLQSKTGMIYSKCDFLVNVTNKEEEKQNLLFLSAGRRTKLLQNAKKAFGNGAKIFAADMNATAPALYVADNAFLVPSIRSDDYISNLLEICKSNKVSAVTTLIDPEIEILAKNRRLFREKGVLVLAPDELTARFCFNKFEMFKYLTNKGIRTPLTFHSLMDFIVAYSKGDISFPVFIKPICGSGSVGAHRVDSMGQLERDFNSGEFDYIIQELMTGDCDADVYIDAFSHQAVSAFSKRKIETTIGGASKTVSFKDQKLFDFIQEICGVFQFSGPVDMDFFYKDGQYYLSEVNPRFGGAYLHAYGAGVDFFKLIQNNINGIENTPSFGDYDEGVVMMMYDDVIICKSEEMINTNFPTL